MLYNLGNSCKSVKSVTARACFPGQGMNEILLVKTVDELCRCYYTPKTLAKNEFSIFSQQTVTVSKGWIIKIQANELLPQARDGLSICSQRMATISKGWIISTQSENALL